MRGSADKTGGSVQDGCLLVAAEVVAGMLLQLRPDLGQNVPVRWRKPVRILREFQSRLRPLGSHQQRRQVSHRGNRIDEPRSDGASGHGIVFRRFRRLHQQQAAFILDRTDAYGPVAAGAGEDDGGPIAVLLGKCAEEDIDLQALLLHGL